MPIYEYRCDGCGEKSQRLQKISEDASGEMCPSCGKGVLKKTFSLFGTRIAGGSDSCAADAPAGFT